jgi:tubulin alpha
LGGDAARSAVTLFRNTSFVRHAFGNLLRSFEKLYRFRSFVHWYVGEGCEEGVMSEALEAMALCSKGYKVAEKGGAGDADMA